MNRLQEKVAIITGAGKGIGRAIAMAFAGEGAKVAIISRTSLDLESVARDINSRGPGQALPLKADISQWQDVHDSIAKVVASFGRIDVLVNNAAVGGTTKPFDDITEREWNEVMETNVTGTFLMTREVLPSMLRQKSGNIINVSSGAGLKKPRSYLRSVPYTVSKFALEGLSHALAVRLAGTGINVNVLRPGFTRTSMQASWTEEESRKLAREAGKILEPESVNGLALYLASLKPGELTDQGFDTSEWIKKEATGV